MDINALLAQARGGAQSNPGADNPTADSEYLVIFPVTRKLTCTFRWRNGSYLITGFIKNA